MNHLNEATAAEFLAAQQSETRIIIADFYTPRCVICRKMEPMLAAMERQFGDRMRVVKLNAEAEGELAAAYDVRSVPSMLLFRNGELKERRTGFQTADGLRQWLKPFFDA